MPVRSRALGKIGLHVSERAVLGPRSVSQVEGVVREVGVGPVYRRDAPLARMRRALEGVGIEA